VFGSLFGKKNSSQPEIRPDISGSWQADEPVLASQPESIADSTPDTSSLDGLTIEEYAHRQRLATDEVWNRLRRGQLVGRTSRGKVLVYESIGAAAIATPAVSASARQAPGYGSLANATSEGDLPPLEFGATANAPAHSGGSADPSQSLSMIALETAGLPQSTELALLLDHLSLAKEENREILRLTQDTLTKLSSMTDAVVQMKDEVIKSKDTQLAALRDALEEKDRSMARLLQEKEDLEILNRTLGTALGNAAGTAEG
jgi:hypothetical protein